MEHAVAVAMMYEILGRAKQSNAASSLSTSYDSINKDNCSLDTENNST